MIIGTYDEIFSLYPNFKPRILRRRGDNAKQQQTIFDKLEQRQLFTKWNIGSNHPLSFLDKEWQFHFEDGKKFIGTLRDFLPGGVRTTYTSAGARVPIYWGNGLPLYGMSEEAVKNYRREEAERQHAY